MRLWPGFPRFVLALLGVVLVAGLGWVLGPGAAWVLAHFDGVRGLAGKDLAAALDAVRGRALAIATGLIALVAVYYTARNADTARRTFKLGEQGHVTDRYTKAIEQLGSDKLDIRLGGIYALERIARDSARDHSTVMEVLAAFVREHSQDVTTGEAPIAPPQTARLRTDLQAALTVISRRTVTQDQPDMRINLVGADLARADLAGAILAGADLAGAILAGARLIGADLTGARLIGADLTGARLIRANLTSADLARANLTSARLTGADLTHADLAGAILIGADLSRADLASAGLASAGLARAILAGADLSREDLTRAGLTRAGLTRAVLARVLLADSDLTGARLTGANLVDADLTGANLTGADLTGAYLVDANLTDAVLAGVIGLPAHLRSGSGSPTCPEGGAASPEQDGPGFDGG